MLKFTASVQYNDWKGTAAADDADSDDISDYLKNKGLLHEDEFLVAADFYVLQGDPLIYAFVSEKTNRYESLKEPLGDSSKPISVRKIEIEVTTIQFCDFLSDSM